MTGCRIGKVKLKGAATVIPLRAPARAETQQRMIDHAIRGASYYPEGLHGFILIAWDGRTTWASLEISEWSRVGNSQAPHFAAEEVRRALHAKGDW